MSVDTGAGVGVGVGVRVRVFCGVGAVMWRGVDIMARGMRFGRGGVRVLVKLALWRSLARNAVVRGVGGWVRWDDKVGWSG